MRKATAIMSGETLSGAAIGPGPEPAGWSLPAVERHTGLSGHTLLDWERRYGFPSPRCDAAGLRHYPADQVQRLRWIRQVLEAGLAPDQVVPAAPDELARLVRALSAAVPDAPAADELRGRRREIVDRLVAHDVAGLHAALDGALAEVGLGRFVREFIAPLNAEVGDAWMQGRLEVYQEHLYTEAVQGRLRHALHRLSPTDAGRPGVLLTTTSGESHGLGLLMVEAVLRPAGCRCVSLGVQTPPWDVARAAAALQVDVVALSYSGMADPARIVEDLTELRRTLPSHVELWAGGSAALLHRRALDGVQAMTSLDEALEAAIAWRHRHPPSAVTGVRP
ncbi:MAG TPA: cobalamin-dependent protein [Burkholderiaceae bacterium]|nr:cobalamin-dependent protein [Burkholderiaceae bacterium]